MLYAGPVVLRNVLDKARYEHFLCFNMAMFILVSNLQFDSEWVIYLGKLLDYFAAKVPDLYYTDIMTYTFLFKIVCKP